MGIYQTVSDKYIRDCLGADKYEDLYTPCYNLSALLGDQDGKVGRGLSVSVTQDMDITSPGLLVLGQYIMDSTTCSRPDNVLPIDEYTPYISNYAYQLYIQMINNDEDLITISDTDYSPLTAYSISLQPAIKVAIHAAYLDALAVYKELLGASSSAQLPAMTISNLTRFSNNLRWICNEMELLPQVPFTMIEIMRQLHRTILQIRSLPGLHLG